MLPSWIAQYQRAWLGRDVVAGLVAAAIVIPKALAYATIAGLSIQVGLYTALVPTAIYALFGGSRVLSVSSTTTIAILSGAALAPFAAEGSSVNLVSACATLTVLVGAMLLAAAVLKLGFVANFISEPVLIGFKAGIGCVILVDQAPKLLGIHIDKGSFLHNIAQIAQHIPETAVATLLLAVVTIVLLLSVEHWLPKLPAPLVAIGAGIVGMAFFGLADLGIATVKPVPTGLPPLTWPDWQLIEALWPAAAGIALMSFTETVAAGRAFALQGETAAPANRELVATGLANAGSALLGAMPSGGGTSQTAVNRRAGAQSQLAGGVTALTSLAVLLALAPLVGLMPEATLAAVVVVYSVELIKPAEFANIRRVRRMEFRWAVVAFLGVVLLGTLQGIVVAIVVSLASLAFQVADPPLRRIVKQRGQAVYRAREPGEDTSDDEEIAGLLILRPEGRLFFANVDRVGEKIRAQIEATQPQVVLLDLRAVFDLEYTALKSLTDAEARWRERGVRLWLANFNPGMRDAIEASALGRALGPDRLHARLAEAVDHYRAGAR